MMRNRIDCFGWLLVFLLYGLMVSRAFADSGSKTCYPLFENAGAIPKTTSCELRAANATTGMGSFFCTAGTRYIVAYCGDACYAQVADLHAMGGAENTPQAGFHTIQTCMANKSCIEKDLLNNEEWLDAVVSDFVAPYTHMSGEWRSAIKKCDKAPSFVPQYARNKYCEAIMADYHIRHDLQGALNKNGCGAQGDWDKVGNNISQCVADASDPISALISDSIVQILRNMVRNTCISYRTQHHLPVEWRGQ